MTELRQLCPHCLEVECECGAASPPGEYYLEWFAESRGEWVRYGAQTATPISALELHLPRRTLEEAEEAYRDRRAINADLNPHRVVDAEGTMWRAWGTP